MIRPSYNLTVLVVACSPSETTSRALDTIGGAVKACAAQLLVVCAGDVSAEVKSRCLALGGELVVGPNEASKAELCDLALGAASGIVVAVREDTDISNDEWITTLSHVARPGLSTAKPTSEASGLRQSVAY